MKKIKILFILMLLFIGIKEIKAFDNTIKVYDYAQVLTEKEENKLKKEVNEYINNYNVDMVLVTVKHYNQSSIEEYAKTFYNKNEFKKDGIIIVLDLKNTSTHINAFGSLINLYSKNEINNIINQVNGENNYYEKFNKFIKYSNKYLNEFDYNNSYNNIFSSINWISILIPSLIIPTIVILIIILKNKKIKKVEKQDIFTNDITIVINQKEDKFITTNTKKSRINNK